MNSFVRYFHPAVLIFQRKRFEQQQQAWDLPRASRDCLVRPKIIWNVLLSLFHTATFVPSTLLESCIRTCSLIVWSGLRWCKMSFSLSKLLGLYCPLKVQNIDTGCMYFTFSIHNKVRTKHTIVSKIQDDFQLYMQKPSWEFCAGGYYNTMINLRCE